jgi:hypothetical protein
VCDNARALEETDWTNAFGAIDDLGWEGKVAWGNLFTEGADGAEGEDGANAEVFEGSNVSAGGNGGGRDTVMFTVASDEGEACPRGEGADGDGGRRVSPGLIGVG